MRTFYLRRNSNIIAALTVSSVAISLSTEAKAEKLSAGVVMEKMSGGDRYLFVAGIIEGLSIARYGQGGKKPEGMNCISDWFYQDPKALDNIYAAFGRFAEYPPGSVVDALARKQCP